MKLTVLAALALALSSAQPAAAWFSCHGNLNATEATICAYPHLMDLDSAMQTRYYETLDFVDGLRATSIRESQRAWLNLRNSCGWDPGCIEQMYRFRIYQFDQEFEGE